jgi:hypothetical protein
MGEEEPEEKRKRGIYGFVLIARRGERKNLFIFCAGTRLALTVGVAFFE